MNEVGNLLIVNDSHDAPGNATKPPKKKKRFPLVAVIIAAAVIFLAACGVIGYIFFSAYIDSRTPPDMKTVLGDSAGVIFREWYDVKDAVNAILYDGDVPAPRGYELDLKLDREATGFDHSLSVKLSDVSDVGGVGKTDVTLKNSLGHSMHYAFFRDGNHGIVSVDGYGVETGKGKEPLFTYDLDGDIVKDFRESGWNPANNDESPFDEELFEKICGVLESLKAETSEEDDPGFTDELRAGVDRILAKLAELGDVTFTRIADTNGGKELAIRYDNGDLIELIDEARIVCAENYAFRSTFAAYMISGNAGEKTDPDGIDDYLKNASEFFSAPGTSFEIVITARVADGLLNSAELLFTFTQNNEKSGVTAVVTPSYAAGERGLDVSIDLYDYSDTGEKIPGASIKLGYSVREKGDELIFAVDFSETAADDGETTFSLTLNYDGKNGDFSFTPEIPDNANDGKTVFSGKVTNADGKITVSDTIFTYYSSETHYNAADGLSTVEIPHKFNDVITFSLGRAGISEAPSTEKSFNLFTASKARVGSLTNVAEKSLTVLGEAFKKTSEEKRIVSLDGVICEPSSTFTETGMNYIKAFAAYANGCPVPTAGARVYDESLGCYVLLHADSGMIFANFVFDINTLTDEQLAVYHEASVMNGQLTVHKLNEEVTPATCTTDKITVYSCRICGESGRVRTEGSATGHKLLTVKSSYIGEDGKEVSYDFEYCEACQEHFSLICSDHVLEFAPDESGKNLVMRSAGNFTGYANVFVPRYPDAKLAPVNEIGEYAFGDARCATVRIDEGISVIDRYAFYGSALQLVIIPATVTEIGANAFADCRDLELVLYTGSAEEWSKINVSGGNKSLLGARIVYDFDGGNTDGMIISQTEKAAIDDAYAKYLSGEETSDFGKLAETVPGTVRLSVGKIDGAAYDEASGNLYVLNEKRLYVYNGTTGEFKAEFEEVFPIASVAAGGGLLAVGSAEEPKIKIYDTVTGGIVTENGFPKSKTGRADYISGLVVDPDNKTVFYCDSDQHCDVLMYDAKTDTHKQISSEYEPQLVFSRERHEIAVFISHVTPRSVHFIGTADGVYKDYYIQRTSDGLPEGFDAGVYYGTRSYKIENVIVPDKLKSPVDTEQPIPLSDVDIREYLPETVTQGILKQLRYADGDISVTLYFARDNTPTTYIKTAKGTTVLPCYADGFLKLSSTRVLLWSSVTGNMIIVNI